MIYATHQMQLNSDKTGSNSGQTHRYTVQEAARLLGITPEAVRTRLSRGTLAREKDPDGSVHVRLPIDKTGLNNDRTTDQTGYDTTVVEEMRAQIDLLHDQVGFLRRELERKDAILLRMAERIPELPPASSPVPPESHEKTGDGYGRGDVSHSDSESPPQSRSWLYRFFFGS